MFYGASMPIRVSMANTRVTIASWYGAHTGVIKVCSTHKEACMARGLLSDDTEWHECMHSACEIVVSASRLRVLLCTILKFNHPSEPQKLVDAFVSRIGDDFVRQYGLVVTCERDCSDLHAIVLLDLEEQLELEGRKLEDFKVNFTPTQREAAKERMRSVAPTTARLPRMVRDELEVDRVAMRSLYDRRIVVLTPQQCVAYDRHTCYVVALHSNVH